MKKFITIKGGTMKKHFRSIGMALMLVTAMVLLKAAASHAGSGGTEFEDIYTTITGWTAGGLGKTIAAGAFLTGIAMGVVRQSVMACVTGLATALSVYYTPTIISNIVVALI
jgi:conjugal transfer pilus assembly protein TraA